jgi:hypothetical protein
MVVRPNSNGCSNAGRRLETHHRIRGLNDPQTYPMIAHVLDTYPVTHVFETQTYPLEAHTCRVRRRHTSSTRRTRARTAHVSGRIGQRLAAPPRQQLSDAKNSPPDQQDPPRRSRRGGRTEDSIAPTRPMEDIWTRLERAHTKARAGLPGRRPPVAVV